ncbi:MAG: hypothetical protein JW954_07605 [Dehalococcoidaceae bacterium]|nr:hypothetical protein [Dehalococcoidaceae bacterium]
MREFDETDKEKKSGRIKLPPNPAGLSEEKLSEIRTRVAESLESGYLPCPAAWKIARQSGVVRIAVGAVADEMGKRVVDCQIGCFKVDKTPFGTQEPARLSPEISAEILRLNEENSLTCEAVFTVAKTYRLKPTDIAGEINALGLKVSACQLGCF